MKENNQDHKLKFKAVKLLIKSSEKKGLLITKDMADWICSDFNVVKNIIEGNELTGTFAVTSSEFIDFSIIQYLFSVDSINSQKTQNHSTTWFLLEEFKKSHGDIEALLLGILIVSFLIYVKPRYKRYPYDKQMLEALDAANSYINDSKLKGCIKNIYISDLEITASERWNKQFSFLQNDESTSKHEKSKTSDRGDKSSTGRKHKPNRKRRAPF